MRHPWLQQEGKNSSVGREREELSEHRGEQTTTGRPVRAKLFPSQLHYVLILNYNFIIKH